MGRTLYENEAGFWVIGQDECLFSEIYTCLQNVYGEVMLSFVHERMSILKFYDTGIGWDLNSWDKWQLFFSSGHTYDWDLVEQCV